MFDFDENGHRMLPVGAFEPYAPGRMRLHGSKGSSSPPPDPRLIEAQVTSLNKQNDMADRIVGLSEEMAPLQREQMQFGLDSAKTAFDQAQEDRGYALERRDLLTTQQDRLVKEADDFNSDARRSTLRNEAYADVNAAFANAGDQAQRNLSRRGVNPNSGQAVATANQTAIAQASALAGAGQKASTQARSEGYALTDRATNALAGYPTMSQQSTAAGAAYGTAGLDVANKGTQGIIGGTQAAANTYGNVASGASSAYNAQASAHAAGQQQDNTAQILGSVAGIAAMFLSDPRTKEDVEKVGEDKRTGLGIYEFEYKGDPSDQRYQGVMADEVRKKHPSAVKRGKDGLDRVDYGQLGLEMVKVD